MNRDEIRLIVALLAAHVASLLAAFLIMGACSVPAPKPSPVDGAWTVATVSPLFDAGQGPLR